MKLTYSLGVILLSTLYSVNTLAEEINFNRDIKPILSDRCFHCHGPDEETREGHLRLDIPDGKDGAFRVRKNKAAIVPGKPEQSHLYLRIITGDEDDVMPPLDSHKKALSAKEKETFKQWIKEGAKWANHWAFEKPVKPAVPQVQDKKWAKNPIDNFILSNMSQKGLKPSSEAPRYKLIRRLSYDLNGLPPTPAEVDAFVNDKSPKAYENLVDRLLSKKAYGERMALPWLDMARYGDSSVYHADGPRFMWPWRDWVIKAYNQNKPFDQFTIEQIAGDHIKDKTYDQHIATAFLRNNGTTDEGGAFFEEYRVEYTVDRLSTVSKIWLGLTTECAQCHDHKYDPISQEEFYEMYAFFNVAADPGRQTRKGNQAPVLKVTKNDSQQKIIDSLTELMNSYKKKEEDYKKAQEPNFNKWLTKQSKLLSAKSPLDLKGLRHFFPYNSQYTTDDFLSPNVVKHPQINRLKEVNGLDEHKDPKSKKLVAKTRALNFNNQAAQYGDKGNWIDVNSAFTASTWIRYSPQKHSQLLFSKWDKKAKKGYEFYITKDHKLLVNFTSEVKKSTLVVETEKLPNHNKWQLLSFSYDGSGKGAGIKVYTDGKLLPQKVLSDTLKGSVKTKSAFTVAKRDGHNLKSPLTMLQIYDRVLSVEEIKASLKMKVQDYLYTKENLANKDFLAKSKYYYFNKIDRKYRGIQKQVSDQQNRVNQAKNLNVMVMQDTKRPTYILSRGAYDQPQKDKEIFPSTPKVLPPMKKEYPKNRLGLAKWIMDEDNPLTARVTVNRYWMMLFGHGLVDTVADFGNQGSWPTHPELLDWLAVDFQKNGWDVKRMIKQLVMTATYRQDSVLTKDLLKADKGNKLYARGPRFRLTGEHIRDTALFVSGLLNPQIGGPSVKPFQPPGLWAEVALTNAKFVQDKGDKNYRKSMYTYYKRSAPVPNMTTFDAPSREKCVIERSRTNTPLQALITLNDPIFVEASRFFAERIMLEGGKSISEKIDFAFKNAISRKPESDVRELVEKLFAQNLKDFKEDPNKSKALLAVGAKPANAALNASELAAWTVIAQLIMNMDETLNKE